MSSREGIGHEEGLQVEGGRCVVVRQAAVGGGEARPPPAAPHTSAPGHIHYAPHSYMRIHGRLPRSARSFLSPFVSAAAFLVLEEGGRACGRWRTGLPGLEEECLGRVWEVGLPGTLGGGREDGGGEGECPWPRAMLVWREAAVFTKLPQ